MIVIRNDTKDSFWKSNKGWFFEVNQRIVSCNETNDSSWKSNKQSKKRTNKQTNERK